MKLSQYAKKNSIAYQTAYAMYRKGLLPGKQLPTGTIVIFDEVEPRKEFNVIYSRVSSSENKSNLESQAKRLIDFCLAKGWVVHQVVKECASGLNDRRPKLTALLEEQKATRIIVEHKDRLTRFGLAYIEILCKQNDCELVIVNPSETEREDLIQDFISIITSFCARIYGQRRCRRKTEKIIAELKND